MERDKDMGLAVTEESVEIMNSTAAGIEENMEAIKQAIETLKSSYEENADGLGPHSQDIQALIEELEAITNQGDVPAKKLILKLVRLSAGYQKMIDENPYKGRSR